jgi:hypothetical protein
MKGSRAKFLFLSFVVAVVCFGIAAETAVPSAPPPGLLGEGRSASYVVRLSSEPVAPVRGKDILRALVTDGTGSTVADAQLSFDLDMIRMSHGKNVVDAVSQGKGLYAGEVHFLMPGLWRVIVRVARPGHDPESLRFEFNVKWM